MIKLKTLFALIITLLAISTHAQKAKTDANIVGHVIDAQGEHIPFVSISLEGTTIGTTTDKTGHYQLVNLPLGNHKLKAQFLGYKPQVKEVLMEAKLISSTEWMYSEAGYRSYKSAFNDPESSLLRAAGPFKISAEATSSLCSIPAPRSLKMTQYSSASG